MDKIDFHALNDCQKKLMLEVALRNKGSCVSVSEGMCAEIYVFDQGENVFPRYVCAKIPKPLKKFSIEEINNRFVNELKKQLSYNHHIFVHWAFDFLEVFGSPVALFRYWGRDLEKVIRNSEISSSVEKLSIMVYVCSGLSHCYKRGLVAHQDLKPANIFLRDLKGKISDSRELDVYNFALVADFGLANAFLDSSIFGGSRPYMAPEQWAESELSSKTDVFALGVILYELMSGGFHPVGIKLGDYWPRPVEGNSKKWTKPDAWRRWAETARVNFEISPSIEPSVKSLVHEMLSIDPVYRPSIEVVKIKLLDIIRNKSQKDFAQLDLFLNYYENKASVEPLNYRWPYLAERWERFQAKFENRV